MEGATLRTNMFPFLEIFYSFKFFVCLMYLLYLIFIVMSESVIEIACRVRVVGTSIGDRFICADRE